MTSSSIEGTDARGARSERLDAVLNSPARRVLNGRGGEEEKMPVEEVGTGVGYFDFPLPYLIGEYLGEQLCPGEARATRLAGRGSDGDEDGTGSKAGSKVGADSAGRLTPATEGRSANALREGDSIASRACWRRTRLSDAE